MIRNRYWIFFLLLLTGIVFFPLSHSLETNWDDGAHSFGNPLVTDTSPGALKRVFTTVDSVNRTYVPLTLLSFRIQGMFGLDRASASHLINVSLHIGIVLLIYLLGLQLKLSRLAAFVAAAVFAVHPLHVEPVAWITSRKDVLYGVFYIASLLFYVKYYRQNTGRYYILSLMCAGLSVLAKPMALSLPLVLFVFDFLLERGLSQKLFLEKLPFVLVVELIAMVTYLQNSRWTEFLFPESIFLFVWSAAFYIEKFFWPLNLSPLYAPPVPVMAHLKVYLSGFFVILTALSCVVVFRKSRWVPFGFLFYVVSVFFLWRTDGQDITIVGDRFMYIPSIGLCLLLGWLCSWAESFSVLVRGCFLVMACSVLFLMSLSAYRQTDVWKNCWTLWSQALRVTPGHPVALAGRIKCVVNNGSLDSCRSDVVRDMRGRMGRQNNDRGVTSQIDRRLDYFIFLLFRHDVKVYPDIENDVDVLNGMGHMYCKIGAPARGLVFFKKAIRLFPDDKNGFYNEGAAYFSLRDYVRAIDSFDRYVTRWPEVPAAYAARAKAYFMNGQPDKALNDALYVLRLVPQDRQARVEAHFYQTQMGLSDGVKH